ncbi:MarR family winged helix-turn-helix transcriptional regulator [Sinosporangium siamense]|uniref:MarR family transcriptional regulator n=1 Tax=Sinosporangium siamense TaxID=1367973 RepID=A0A919REL5_9ACTN|nr:MarR family transcriptional regulator [Sinosporangium siamense]GII92470.1 MarR family transcriptional regulator [Sinosporangium siamense]
MDKYSDTELLNSIRTVIRLARIAQQACEEAGLTMAQYRALTSAVAGRQRAYELAQYTAVSRPAISALTSGMVRDGLIERSGLASDGRGVVFDVTDQGLEMLRNAEHLLIERFEHVLGDATSALEVLDSLALEDALDQQADKDFGVQRRPKGSKNAS